MNHGSQPVVVRVPGRARLAVGVCALATSLVAAAVGAVGAAADAGSAGTGGSAGTAGTAGGALCTPASGNPSGCATTPPTTRPPTSPSTQSPSQPTSPTSPPVTSGTPSTRTSYTWSFEDGTPGSWYGHSRYGWGVPWLAPSAEAAASGRGGLLVGGVPGDGSGVAVDVSQVLVAPGTYAVTARVRLAPGQWHTRFELNGPQEPLGTGVSDDAWTTLKGVLVVPAGGAASRLTVAPGEGYCGGGPNAGDYASATSFHLDEVTVTRSGGLPTSPSPTVTPTPTAGCPTYSAAPPATAKIHYEVTSTGPNGFTATLVLTNLRDTPITDWSVYVNSYYLKDRRILWVSGGRQITISTSTGSESRLVGTPGNTVIPGRGQVRISLGVTGGPVGSADAFGGIEGQQTGRN